MAKPGLASMTAFATAEGAGEGQSWTWEMRGVNGRGLDLRLRLPDGLGALEVPLRGALQKALKRGNVSVGLRLQRHAGGGTAKLDPDALLAVLAALAEVEHQAEGRLRPSSGAEVLGLRGVMDVSESGHLPAIDTLMAEAQEVIAVFGCHAPE